MIFKFSNFKFN